MAAGDAPFGMAGWKKYVVNLGKAPKHTGSRHQYGPFVVASRTDVKSDDFMGPGGAVVLGEGWTPEGFNGFESDGWISGEHANSGDAFHAGTGKTRSFFWGVLVKSKEAAPIYKLLYFVKETTTATGATITIGPFFKQSLGLTGKLSEDIVGEPIEKSATADVSGTGNGKLAGGFNFTKTSIAANSGNTNTPPDGITEFALFGRFGGRYDGYEIDEIGSGADPDFKITRHYASVGATPDYYIIRDGDDEAAVELENGAVGKLEPAAVPLPGTSPDLDLFSLTAKRDIYLEETMYDENAKVYRLYSDRASTAVLRGGGEVTLHLNYWQGPTPTDSERYPYEVKKVRFTSKDHGSHAIWLD